MIAKIYWAEELLSDSGERFVVRQEEMVYFTDRDALEKQLMMYKISGKLAGYVYYNVATVADLQSLERNPAAWRELAAAKVYEWYDKGAMVSAKKIKPGSSVRAFMK